MPQPLQNTMKAAALSQFGAPEEIRLQTMPVPRVAPDEILIKIEFAGVGSWDAFEREGGYAAIQGTTPSFPYIPGSEGAGIVVAAGERVSDIKIGDCVYAAGFLNPKGGFYAEFVAVRAELACRVPDQLSAMQASAMAGVGLTALRGLDDVLKLKPGESLLIHGASGGIGHLAIQLATRMGARVFAIAGGETGVDLARRLGADAVVDGYQDDVKAATRNFAPHGLDAALITAGGNVAQDAVDAIRDGGRVAYPTGVRPEPGGRSGVDVINFNGEPDHELLERFDGLVGRAPFEVHIAHVFPLAQAAEAHRALAEHYNGKIVLRI